MQYGCDYYPEHRERSLWAQDARWMREAHMNLVRLGCFAWGRMEPDPGVFTFDWIAEALAARFGDHPAVAGWQIDNELGMYGTRCYCPRCQAGFRSWLERKYGTVAKANRRLGLAFGSNEYRSFADAVLPRRRQDLHNPGLRLESQRFFQDSNAAFVARQAAVLRAAGARQPITTNVCHMFSGAQGQDDLKLFAACDVAGFDCYPVQFAAHPRPETMGLLHATARGYKNGRPYWMLEQQSGYCLEHASPGGGYIFGTSNTIFPGMPLAHYEYMLEVYREFCSAETK